MRVLWRSHLLIGLFYLIIAIIITFPVVLSLNTQFLGGDTGDSYEMARHIWWFKTALQTGQSPFWQSNLGYPQGFSGVSLQADILQFFPMWLLAFFMPLASAFNITILLTMALNGWATYWLVRYLLENENHNSGAQRAAPLLLPLPMFPALLSGVIFMAAPTFQGHLFEGHAGLMVQWPAPLYVYALFRLVEGRKLPWRWFIVAVIFFQLAPSGHMLQVIYMLMPVTGLFLLARLWQRDWAGAGRILVMGAVSSVLLLLFLLPLIQETLASEAYTDTGGYVRYSADLLAVITPSFFHPLLGKLPYTAQVLGVNLGEGSMYIGMIAAALAGIGVLKCRPARRWLLLAVVVWMLALGPLLKIFDKPVLLATGEYHTCITLPFALLQNLPGFSLARSPGRFSFALALALAVMAGYGAAWLWAKYFNRDRAGMAGVQPAAPLQTRYMVFFIMVAGIVFEYQSFFPMPTRPAAIPEAVYALKDRDDVRAVFDIPYEHLLAAKDALYLQTAHEKPLIAGHVTRQTPVNPAKLAIMQYTLDPLLLQTRGADIIIFHKQRARDMKVYDFLNQLLRLKFAPPIYEDEHIAIYEAPDAFGVPPFLNYIPPLQTLTGTADFYAYTPQSTWLNFSAQVTADNRQVVLYFDQTPVHRWTITGTEIVNVPLPASTDDFHTVRLSLEPPCPVYYSKTLTCRGVTLENVSLTALPEGVVYDLIEYGRGVELAASSVPAETSRTLTVNLWWRFTAPVRKEDIRFVHVLDEQGQNVVQNDLSFGVLAAGSAWMEAVILDISKLPPGAYSVRAGWYDLNTMQRFEVLTSGLNGGQDDAPEIGKFVVR